MGDFSGLILIFSYLFGFLGLPVGIVLVLIWIYKMKSNSETQVKQNQEIIRLLDKLNKQRKVIIQCIRQNKKACNAALIGQTLHAFYFYLATSYSRRDKVSTTIGAGKLNCCVRYGNRCDLSAIITRSKGRERFKRTALKYFLYLYLED